MTTRWRFEGFSYQDLVEGYATRRYPNPGDLYLYNEQRTYEYFFLRTSTYHKRARARKRLIVMIPLLVPPPYLPPPVSVSITPFQSRPGPSFRLFS